MSRVFTCKEDAFIYFQSHQESRTVDEFTRICQLWNRNNPFLEDIVDHSTILNYIIEWTEEDLQHQNMMMCQLKAENQLLAAVNSVQQTEITRLTAVEEAFVRLTLEVANIVAQGHQCGQ